MTTDPNCSSRNNAALLTQEYFDETVLENQEAFDLSPEEAVKEAIDQFLLQRNHHEVAGQSTNGCQDITTNSTAVSRSIPASLLHLSLTHPDSWRGKLDRENRNEFQNNLNFLDGCVKSDGTLVSFADDNGVGEDTASSDNGKGSIITKELALEALKLVAHRCQFGDDGDKYIVCGCDGNDAANCNNGKGDSKSTTLETASMENSAAEIAYSNKLIGSPLPYLTIFHQTSSIYTLMSFLSAMDPSPTSTTDANTLANGIDDGHATKTSDVILLETVKTLSVILTSPIRTGSMAEKDTSIMLRAELRDSFVPAMTKVVNLIAIYAYITYNNNYHGGKVRKLQVECQLQISILISLLQLGLHATRGCEGAKVAFVQSVIPSSLLPLTGKDSNNGLSGVSKDDGVATVRRGGVKTLVFCLSSFGDVNHCNDPSTLNSPDETASDKSQPGTVANVKVLNEVCQLIASLCRYDDFRDPSFSQQPNPMAGSVGNFSSAHDHAMEFYRAGVLPPLMKIAKGVSVSIRDNGSTVDNCSDPGVGNEQTNNVKSTSMLAIVPGVSKTGEIEERLAASCFTALRVLAINDEIVQTMVALGVLPTVTWALELSLSLDEPPTNGNIDENSKKNTKQEINIAFNGRKQRLAAATLGLIRNLCGNDEIKTNLCLGSGSNSEDSPASVAAFSALPFIFQAMKVYSETAIIQEHACGTLAAMALRRPANARAIIDGDGARLILTAMKRHEANVNVQRQGALAVRNIVSRLLMGVNDFGNDSILTVATDGTAFGGDVTSIRESFLEWGAEDVLRNIAGRNQGSVDEAYAALRDLGCPVSLVKFDAQDLQQQRNSCFKSNVSMGVARTMMFGEQHNSNFRPVFEASDGLEDGVDDAIAKFGG